MAPNDASGHKPFVIPQDAGLEVRHTHSNLEVYQVSNPHPATGQWAYYGSPTDKEAVQLPRKIVGLRAQTFALIMVLVVVVIAAGVGGGVGGSIAVRNARSQAQPVDQNTKPAASTVPNSTPSTSHLPSSTSASASSTSTSTSAPTSTLPYVPPAASVAEIDIACPSVPVLTSWSGTDYFECIKSTDMLSGDIGSFSAYSLRQCIDACISMNKRVGRNDCIGVTIGKYMSELYKSHQGANCYLKGGGFQETTNDRFTSARLCTTSKCDRYVDAV